MTRPVVLAFPLLLAAGLVAAQPPNAAPKPAEPTHDGKPLSEWVKQLKAEEFGKRQQAVEAVRAMSASDAVAEALFAAATGPNSTSLDTLNALLDLGPRAVPVLTAGLWSADEPIRNTSMFLLSRLGADARPAAPSLTRLLAGADGVDDRSAAAGCLGDVGAHSAIPALVKALGDRSSVVRLVAATTLARLGSDPAPLVPVFADLLKEGDANEQLAAARRVGLLGPEGAAAVPALVEALAKADTSLAGAVAGSAADIGPAAKDVLEPLKKRLAADKGTVRFRMLAAVALWKIARDPDAPKVLSQLLPEANLTLAERQWTTAALMRIDPGPDTVGALADLLKADDPDRAIPTAEALAPGSKEAVPFLGKMLAHKDAGVRMAAVAALVRLGPRAKGAADALKAATRDEDPQVAFWATVCTCRFDPKPAAVAAVAGYLSDRDAVVRRNAAALLEWLGPPAKPAVASLIPVLGDPEEAVRFAAATALWKIDRHRDALPTAVKLLRSTDPRVRGQVALEIGLVFEAGAKAAVPELVKCLFDPFAEVRSRAAQSLGRIGPVAKGAAPALLAVLEADEPAFVHSAACEALGLIDPADTDTAPAVLRRQLEHPDPLTRAHAALSLFTLTGDRAGEKEADRGLGARHHQIRITSAETLWRIRKDARVVPFLVRTLEESNLDGTGDENERYMAARLVGRIGPDAKAAVPELRKLLAHHDSALAATAADALKVIDPKRGG